MKRVYLFLAILLSFSAVLATEISDKFESAMRTSESDSMSLEIIRYYLTRTDDIDDLRTIQNYWQRLNPVANTEYFQDLKNKHPKDKKYIYLWARSINDLKVQIKTGRQLVKKYPDFEYGYRLLLSVYQKELFTTPGTSHPDAQAWLKDFKQDKKYFNQYLKKFPGNENAMYLVMSLLVWENKVDAANLLLSKALSQNASWLNWQFYTDYYLRTNQLDMLQAYLRRMIDTSEVTEKLSAEEKESQFEQTYLSILLRGEAYTAVFDYFDAYPQALNALNNQKLYIYVCANLGDTDKAFTMMDKALVQSSDLYSWLSTDSNLSPLRKDPRWEPKLNEFRRIWAQGLDKRKADILSNKLNIPAPLWELKDINGNIVKLADQKGSIVILDFWATWCGPCQQAMPVLDTWMKNKMPAGVKVFSINVWERDLDKVAPFMTEHNYAMTLLYGTNNLSKDYGFEGIPYLCVIDRDGNIRFEETGYSSELEENLTFWVEDLL